jgi:hypothetical protein
MLPFPLDQSDPENRWCGRNPTFCVGTVLHQEWSLGKGIGKVAAVLFTFLTSEPDSLWRQEEDPFPASVGNRTSVFQYGVCLRIISCCPVVCDFKKNDCIRSWLLRSLTFKWCWYFSYRRNSHERLVRILSRGWNKRLMVCLYFVKDQPNSSRILGGNAAQNASLVKDV